MNNRVLVFPPELTLTLRQLGGSQIHQDRSSADLSSAALAASVEALAKEGFQPEIVSPSAIADLDQAITPLACAVMEASLDLDWRETGGTLPTREAGLSMGISLAALADRFDARTGVFICLRDRQVSMMQSLGEQTAELGFGIEFDFDRPRLMVGAFDLATGQLLWARAAHGELFRSPDRAARSVSELIARAELRS